MKKSLNFDLDTNKLKLYYANYNQAYYDIKNFLASNGFKHRQGSGYISKKDMTNIEITDKIKQLNKKFDWLKDCCKVLDYYSVGKEYNGLDIIINTNTSTK